MKTSTTLTASLALTAALVFAPAGVCQNQQAAQPPSETVHAIAPPRNPLPPENESARVTRFSFIAYGDTRGRRDGREIQYEHSLIVDSTLATIKQLEKTDYPVRFVLQTGDAVVNGRDPKQWNASFVELINRLTTEGGVPYFLAPGNHDVTSAPSADAPMRQDALRNYLNAVAQLIPADGAQRRLDGYPTYAFGYGNSFFIAIDSNLALDEKQFDWVKKQIEGLDPKRFKNIVAFFHHPPFSSGPHGGSRVEPQSAAIRSKYLPLFRKHRVSLTLTGHDHLFDHWVEHYQGSDGVKRRMDHVVTGGGGAPIYPYLGEPDLRDYTNANESEKITIDHLVRPGQSRGDNPYHYLVVKIDDEVMSLEVIGVDWGSDFKPYRSNRSTLRDSSQ
ncbi:MAG TPA: metallophosphoesterase [Blastocatellia bacterium]|nr:metallophosphoesterase [Blastocatellia bacterium]